MQIKKKTIKFNGSCLKQDKAFFTPLNRVNLFIVYELDRWLQDLKAKITLKDFSFAAVKLTKNAHPDQYCFSGYGIGFNSHLVFHFWILIRVKIILLFE